MGLIRDATKILVTHQLNFLRDARMVVMLGNGKIEKVGTPKEILQLNSESPEDAQHEDAEKDSEVQPDTEAENVEKSSVSSEDQKKSNIEKTIPEEEKYNLIEPEERMSGAVAFNVYHYYVKTTGYILSLVILLSLLFMQGPEL